MARARGVSRKVSFTKSTARRIARAVLEVERGDASTGAPQLRSAGSDDALVRGTFTGAWAKGDMKDVTDATLSSVKYKAKNYFSALTGTTEKQCCLAYVAGEWILIAVEC